MTFVNSRPWLSGLPDGWNVQRIKHVVSFAGGGTPSKTVDEYWGGTIPWVSPKDMKVFLVTETQDYITDAAVASSACSLIDAWAILMVVRSGILQHTIPVAINGVPVCLNQDMKALIPDEGASSKYLAYLIQGLNDHFLDEWVKQGATVESIEHESMANTPIPVPPIGQQLAIASYLDVETARIDALIEEKQRLVRLLKEQKRMVAESVIAPAPGGREAKLGFFVDLLPGYAFPSEGFTQVQTDLPLLRGVNVAPGAVRWQDVVYWPSDQTSGLERFRLEAGDVVFGMDRPWISSGTRVAMIDEASAGALLLQRVCRIRGDETMSNRFVYHALSSDKFRQSIEFELSGISVPHISPEQITRFRVPLLSIEVQHSRCTSADAELAEIDQLISVTVEMVAALQELRSTTITDAVLGRIDVRDYMKTE